MIDPIDFVERLNRSVWKCGISEVGLGVPFQARLFSQSGASKTVLYTESRYSVDLSRAKGIRQVSEEAVKAQAASLFQELSTSENRGDLFTVAITATHKEPEEVGETHGWIAIHALGIDQTMHFWSCLSRKEMTEKIDTIICWFVNAVLLEPREWGRHIASYVIGNRTGIQIDSVSTLTVDEAINLVSSDNPIVLRPVKSTGDHKFVMERAVATLREGKPIFRGSFNPPTLAHFEFGGDNIYDVSLSNCRKDTITTNDAANRVRMLLRSGKTVMVSDEPYFWKFSHYLQVDHKINNRLTYLVGSDTFSSVVEDRNMAVHIKHSLEKSDFLVGDRPGYPVVETEHSDDVNWSYIVRQPNRTSSTKVREGDLSLVSPEVKRYIEEHRLYGFGSKVRQVPN